MSTALELLDAYAAAYERVSGHPNHAARAMGIAAVLEAVADDIDRGPTFPIPPSVVSALVREKAADVVAAVGGPGPWGGAD